MKDQRWISELSPEPRTMYSLHQSLHPGRHPDSDPNPWRRNRLERARDFHEAGTIPQLVYKSKFPRIMGSTAQFFCPGKYHGTMLIQRQPCTHIKKKKSTDCKMTCVKLWSHCTLFFNVPGWTSGSYRHCAVSSIMNRGPCNENFWKFNCIPVVLRGLSSSTRRLWLKKKNLRKNRRVSKIHNGTNQLCTHFIVLEAYFFPSRVNYKKEIFKLHTWSFK